MAEKPSILDPFKPIIQKWLEDDKKHWRKQHHTAQRVYDRLAEEHGYTGSYSIVQRYLKKCRMQQVEKANLELVWDPGPAQVDFGEADFYEAGKTCRKKYLTVSFPYSNDGYSQVFGGETAECVCQGLQDIFEFIGGVPPLLIFDNATGVGRRVGDSIHESELFLRFHASIIPLFRKTPAYLGIYCLEECFINDMSVESNSDGISPSFQMYILSSYMLI